MEAACNHKARLCSGAIDASSRQSEKLTDCEILLDGISWRFPSLLFTNSDYSAIGSGYAWLFPQRHRLHELCTYHRWFGRPQNAACPSYWESPMGNAKLHRILRFRMGSHHLPVEEGCHFNLPRASRVCNLCNTDALGDERHMLLECPALADLRLQFSSLLLPCSGVMRRLLWAKDQHEVCRYIIACLDRMSSH